MVATFGVVTAIVDIRWKHLYNERNRKSYMLHGGPTAYAQEGLENWGLWLKDVLGSEVVTQGALMTKEVEER